MIMDIEKRLDQAVAFHQAGQLSKAERLCQQVLADNPRNADALHLLGVVAYQVGRHEIAVNLITHAIEIDPQQIEAYNNLGIVFKEQKKLEKSIQTYHKAIEINPDHAEAHYNLGNAYQEQGKSEKSIQAYHKAIKIQPDYAEVYNNLGIVFKEQGKLEKSIQAYHKAIEIKPNYAEAYNNLGNAYQEQGKSEKSIQAYHKAIEIKPNYMQVYNNMGNAYQEQGELELAIQAYHKAIKIQPNFAEAHNNLGQILLLLGNFHQGWEEYEWRWQCRNSPAGERNFPQPLWNGSNLHGKSILVWTEQGLGDEIMFANLLDSLKKIGTNIIVECEKRLVPFFQRSFPEIQFAPRENPPNSRLLNSDIDYQIPIGSLGQWLRTDEDSFKQNRQSYLTTCAEKSEQIQKRYKSLADDNILVGISWKSIGIKQRQTLSKSTALKDWTSILSQRDCHFINLQYGDTEPELEQFQAVTGLRIYHDQEIDPLQNLDDFAAQVSALDLVISTSNTTAHIAGALGKRVWTLLPYMPDWRWMLNRNDTLWYPCMRLFRQHTIGDWNDVFQRVGLALEQYVMNDKTDPKP